MISEFEKLQEDIKAIIDNTKIIADKYSIENIEWIEEDKEEFTNHMNNIYLRSNMSEFSVVSEYYNKQHKITAKIIKEDERFWLMMVPKDQGLKYYDDISQIEAMLKIKNFEKIEKSKD